LLKEKIKRTSDEKEKYALVLEATSLYIKSSERYYTVSKLRLARMSRSINSDIHITKALAFSVQNLATDDDKEAIKLLNCLGKQSKRFNRLFGIQMNIIRLNYL
jgi:hypothetical protein